MKKSILIMIIFVMTVGAAYSAMIPTEFIDATVAIGVRNPDNSIDWIGSGFVVGKLDKILPSGKGSYKMFLVTNKHVIADKSNLIVRMNPTGKTPSIDYSIPSVSDKDNLWVFHPNKDIDIAIHFIDPSTLLNDNINRAYFRTNDGFITKSEMSKMGISEGDFIYVLGFPLGIVDKDRQYVIAKGGVIARIKDIYDSGKSEFLIDAKVYPGNSGGPVVLRPESNAIEGTKEHNRAGLIGIVKAYIPYREVAISLQTKAPRIIFEENSGLAVVIPVDFISETIREFYNKHHLEYAIDKE